MTSDMPLLQVKNLEKYYDQQAGIVDWILRKDSDPVQAVDGVSFSLDENESMGVIGESGCGKTTLIETLIGLHEPTSGEILFKGTDVSTFDKGDWKQFRREVQMIFQDPFNALDPKLTVRETLEEQLKIHDIDGRDRRIRDVLEQVELSPVDNYLDRLPKQLSGGQKQRVSIARALIVEPELILADEPVSMLDVSTQAAILQLLSDLIDDFGVSMVYISHDLSTVSYVCHQLQVMYLGRVVESGATEVVLNEPKHPYTRALLSAIPIPDSEAERERTELPGTPGDPINIGNGCRFRDRCPDRMEICDKTPESYSLSTDHHVACHLHSEHEDLNAVSSNGDVANGQSISAGEGGDEL
ncbi:ABC transporter ATP-binding protein [Natrialba sp. INN-245]|uniref:ABC transporter ATP-binding protein n=1 Tax=Natrialba sp. INN-245 TaxID=2690967 RepID=UPI0013133482|nr:ABC transporter ATP-binding protein [Natrialba sp. INN-245]MWV38470.1 ATP-binding cassette domain-containing protein [Natrialba sp. INN-245]